MLKYIITTESLLKTLNFPQYTTILFNNIKDISIFHKNSIAILDNEKILEYIKNFDIPTICYSNPIKGFFKSYYLIDDLNVLDLELLQEIFCHYYKIPLKITTTARTYIRELSEQDIFSLYEIYQNIDTIPNLSPNIELEKENLNTYIKSYEFFGYGLWGVFLKENNKLIGRCGLQNITINQNDYIEIGYLISKKYQHQGYGYEVCKKILDIAHNRFKIKEVVAVIEKNNLNSIKLAEKLGIKIIYK